MKITASEEFIKSVKESRKLWEEKVEKNKIPQHILEFMSKKTEEVNTLNEGTLDKSTFKLGMMCMYDAIINKVI